MTAEAEGDARGSRTERMVAAFEAEAKPIVREGADESAVEYALRITRVRDAAQLTDRAAHPPSAGLEVDDTYASIVTATGESPITLKRVEILEGFDFDLAQGRVTGTLLFDRVIEVEPLRATVATSTEDADPVVDALAMPVVNEGRVSVVAGEGVEQFYDAVLSWTNAAIDLDAHGLHFARSGETQHVWHRHRPLGPLFWHYGASTPEALDERLAITSAPVDGLILYVVHSPVDVSTTPVRAIAESGARVVLQLPNVRQSMHFEAPDREGNLWIPFAMLDGRLITTDVVTAVRELPSEAGFRALLGDLFQSFPAPVPVDVPAPPVPDEPMVPFWEAQRPAVGLGALAIALTLLVASLRGAGRGAIMAIVSLLIVSLVVRARVRQRRG